MLLDVEYEILRFVAQQATSSIGVSVIASVFPDQHGYASTLGVIECLLHDGLLRTVSKADPFPVCSVVLSPLAYRSMAEYEQHIKENAENETKKKTSERDRREFEERLQGRTIEAGKKTARLTGVFTILGTVAGAAIGAFLTYFIPRGF